MPISANYTIWFRPVRATGVRDFVLDNPQSIGGVVRIAVPTSDDIDLLITGLIDRTLPESDRLVSNKGACLARPLYRPGPCERAICLDAVYCR